MTTAENEKELEELMQNAPDDTYNLWRLMKIMLECPRCTEEWDKIGGSRFTLEPDLEQRLRKLAAMKGFELIDE